MGCWKSTESSKFFGLGEDRTENVNLYSDTSSNKIIQSSAEVLFEYLLFNKTQFWLYLSL